MDMSTFRIFYSFTIMDETNRNKIDTINKDMVFLGYSIEEVKQSFKQVYPHCSIEYVRKMDKINHITKSAVDFILLQKSPEYRKEKEKLRREETQQKIKANNNDAKMRNMKPVKDEGMKENFWGIH